MDAIIKERALQLLDEMPDDATFEDLMHELYELRVIERGLAASKAGHLTPHEEAKERVLTRLRKSA